MQATSSTTPMKIRPLRTGALRVMLAGLSLVKIGVWGTAFVLPGQRDRARKELRSNVDVVKVCWKLA